VFQCEVRKKFAIASAFFCHEYRGSKFIIYNKGAHVILISRIYLRILGNKQVTRSTTHSIRRHGDLAPDICARPVQIWIIFFTRLPKQSNPITSLDRPRGFQEVEAPRFQDNRHMEVVRLSALRTDRLCRPGNIPGTPVSG